MYKKNITPTDVFNSNNKSLTVHRYLSLKCPKSKNRTTEKNPQKNVQTNKQTDRTTHREETLILRARKAASTKYFLHKTFLRTPEYVIG